MGLAQPWIFRTEFERPANRQRLCGRKDRLKKNFKATDRRNSKSCSIAELASASATQISNTTCELSGHVAQGALTALGFEGSETRLDRGYAARRCPMLGELSLVYVGMPRNSARLVALLLNRQIMREDGAKTMSKGVTDEISGPGDTTETTSRDVTSMTTNEGHVRR